jgi:hypothetical protein
MNGVSMSISIFFVKASSTRDQRIMLGSTPGKYTNHHIHKIQLYNLALVCIKVNCPNQSSFSRKTGIFFKTKENIVPFYFKYI